MLKLTTFVASACLCTFLCIGQMPGKLIVNLDIGGGNVLSTSYIFADEEESVVAGAIPSVSCGVLVEHKKNNYWGVKYGLNYGRFGMGSNIPAEVKSMSGFDQHYYSKYKTVLHTLKMPIQLKSYYSNDIFAMFGIAPTYVFLARDLELAYKGYKKLAVYEHKELNAIKRNFNLLVQFGVGFNFTTHNNTPFYLMPYGELSVLDYRRAFADRYFYTLGLTAGVYLN